MGGSEINYYRWPLYSLFFRRGRKLSFRGIQVSRSLQSREGSRMKLGLFGLDPKVLVVISDFGL